MMGSNSVEKNSSHIVSIWEVNKDLLDKMHEKISQNPRLLSKAAGKRTCCIFRVPKSLIDINGNSYQPHIVSIGPYHRGEPHLQMIEEHKWRYLGSLLSKTKIIGLTLEDYLKSIHPLEKEARECYSETIHLSSNEFLGMMVVDGCFILELFRKVDNLIRCDPDDPLITMAWILPFLSRDFLRLENQIPYFILERLFEVTKLPQEESGPSLSLLALRFFNYIMQRQDDSIESYDDLKGLHLLDMVRSSFFPPDLPECAEQVKTVTHIIPCVSKLRLLGIRLNPVKADSFLVVKFRHGVIEMPTITIDDSMTSFLMNCVAFEQCHNSCSKHISTYATFLDCLVNTSRDVEYLSDQNIIDNHFGSEAEVARFINNLGKDVVFDIDMCYLSKLFEDVHHYYRDSWHVQWASFFFFFSGKQWASFKYTYFDTPWSFISALAAFVLLILTVAQTFFTVISYVKPKD